MQLYNSMIRDAPVEKKRQKSFCSGALDGIMQKKIARLEGLF